MSLFNQEELRILGSIPKFCETAYDVLHKVTHGLTPKYKLIFKYADFPSDPEMVPACTEDGDEVKDYLIYFNIPLIQDIYYDYLKFICYHEMCHVFCDEIYRVAESRGLRLLQDKLDHKGHPRLFFILMQNFNLTDEEKRMQHYRHEIPYNYGYPSNRILSCFSDDWTDDVETKWTPPEGLFEEGTAEEIADAEFKGHKELKSAMASLNFYLNRGGDNIPNDRRKVIEDAKELLRRKYE